VNFDSDEGFGYGVAVALYHYGDGSVQPYRWSVQPTVFLTTKGRRDYTVFFDAPSLFGGWRLDVFAGSQRQIATPYYGLGNNAVYDPSRVTDADPYYYRFGRRLNSGLVNLQRPLGDSPLRLLIGAGVIRASLDAVPEGTGTTLVAEEIAGGVRPGTEGWINYVRAGLIYDTRNRETAPGRGTWSDILVQRVDKILGSEVGYTRWTITDRRYWRLGPLILVNRLLLQGISGDVPLVDLHRLQASFRDQEGLGGARSVRGLLRNRYAGRGMFLWNTEVRWPAFTFQLWSRSFHFAVSAFLDQGRVWEGQPRPGDLLSGLHRGFGGGVRLGMGPDFVVGADLGTGAETGLQLYVGAGWLF
jgi:outer membrane protein assembly factor BamA